MKHFLRPVIFTILFYSMSISLAAEEAMGWLEGTVKGESGNPLGYWRVGIFNRDGKETSYTYSKGSQGGFFSIRNIKPNVYEIRVYAVDNLSEYGKEFRQQRLFGVAINKGVRSVLNIKLKEGKSRDFVEIGKPNVQTQKVMLLTEEVDELKKQVEELEKTSGD